VLKSPSLQASRSDRSDTAVLFSSLLRCPARLPLHCFVQIPIGLQPHPQLWRGLQQSCEPQRRIRGDAALTKDDLVQPVEGDAEALGRFELPEAERLQILLQENLARRNRRTQPFGFPSDSLRRGLR